MRLKAEHIFSNLSPYRVVADLGLEIEQQDDLFFTADPQNPQHRLQIGEHEFIAHANGSIPAYNVFDFLALYFDSYGKAVDHAINRYHNLALLPVGLPWEVVRGQLVEGLRAERDQFQSILSLREPLRVRSAPGEAYIYCRGHDLDADQVWRMLYFVIGKDLNLALQRLPNWAGALDDYERCMVVPFFKNYHTYALLEVWNLNGKLLRTVHLNPSQRMYFGLHTCFPNNRETQVFSTREEAALSFSYAMQQHEYDTGFVHTRFNPNGEPVGPTLKSGIFIVTGTTGFETLANNRHAFEEFQILDPQGRFAVAREPVAWRDYGTNTVVKSLANDPKTQDRACSAQTSSLIQSVRNDPEVFPALLESLKRRNQAALLEEIQRQTGGRKLFFLGDVQVAETPAGYVASKPGTSLNAHFTNFVINIDCRIWFEETEQTYFSGWLQLTRKLVPFLIADSQMHQPRAILMQAQRAANRIGDPQLPLPIIIDSQHQAKLVSILNQQSAHTTKIVGIQSLGWNRSKDRFIAPTWQAGQGGLEATSKVAHPNSETLARYYSFQEYKLVEDFSQTTPKGRYLIALLAALLVRGFLNLRTRPVSILGSPQAFVLLQSVFRPLGQITPIELPTTPRAIQKLLLNQNLSRYPIFATCWDLAALERVNYPIFLLAKSGPSLAEGLTSKAGLHITALAHRVIKIVAALCHGVALLRYARLSNGEYLAKGKTLTGFANVEEDFADNAVWSLNMLSRDKHIMPWRIEDELKRLGANYVQAGLWRGFAVRDGNLITGQQNFSGEETARLVLETLGR